MWLIKYKIKSEVSYQRLLAYFYWYPTEWSPHMQKVGKSFGFFSTFHLFYLRNFLCVENRGSRRGGGYPVRMFSKNKWQWLESCMVSGPALWRSSAAPFCWAPLFQGSFFFFYKASISVPQHHMFYFNLIRKLLENGMELPVDCLKEDSNVEFDRLFDYFLCDAWDVWRIPYFQIFKKGS